MHDPLITVMIPCKNYGQFLCDAVESILLQSYGNWELFLVDEGSTDNSLEIMKKYEARYPEKITVIENANPIGLQKVSNLVLGRARGKYFIRLDADDWFDENALLNLKAKLDSNPSSVLCFGNFFLVAEDGRMLGLGENPDVLLDCPRSDLPPHGACVLIRTRVLKALGGYHEGVDAQDGWDLWFRISRHGDISKINTPVFFYRQHGNSLSRDKQRLLVARSRIFEIVAKSEQGTYIPKVACIVGVREQYPNRVGVPFEKVSGDKSRLEYAIESVSRIKDIDSIVVSTGCSSVVQFCESLQAESSQKFDVCMRSFPDPDRGLPVTKILRNALEWMSCNKEGFAPDIIMFVGIHSRFDPMSLSKALNVLKVSGSDTVLSAREERNLLLRQSSTGVEILNAGKITGVDCKAERILSYGGEICVTWADHVRENCIFDGRINAFELILEESVDR